MIRQVLLYEWVCDRCRKVARVESHTPDPPMPAAWTHGSYQDGDTLVLRQLCGACEGLAGVPV